MTQRLLSLVLLLFALPALAQSNNELAVSYGRADFEDLGNSPAFGASYAHFWYRGIATRLGGYRAQKDFPDHQGDKMVGAYYATVEYHFFRDRMFSPYLGGGGAYGIARVHFTDNDFTGEDTMLTGFGNAGFDVNVTPRFAIGVDSSYMKFDPDVGNRYGTILNPITTQVSLKYRF